MPNASATIEPTRRDLRTLPGAWVTLRPLPFGKKLERREMMTAFAFAGQDENSQMDIKFMTRITNEFDFAHCIVDHNLFLDDDETQKFDFSEKFVSASLDALDPRIGSEIETYIGELNGELDLKDLEKQSPSSNGAEKKQKTSQSKNS